MRRFNFLHSGDLGDVIFALPAIRGIGGGTLLCITKPGTKAFTPPRFNALRPLVVAQPYIDDMRMFSGEPVHYDFSNFRQQFTAGTTLAQIQAIYLRHGKHTYGERWLDIPGGAKRHKRIIIARSPRYHNPKFDWAGIIRHYGERRFLFVGLPEECEKFNAEFGCKVEYQPTRDFLHLASLIAGSPLFIGNQSSPNAIAEGLKHRMIQETCEWAADCIYPRDNAQHVLEGHGILPAV